MKDWLLFLAILGMLLVCVLLGYAIGYEQRITDVERDDCASQGFEWKRDIGCYEEVP